MTTELARAHWLAQSELLPAALLADVALKGMLVLAATWVATRLMRRASAAARHTAWVLGVAGLALVPALTALLPAWRVLPAWAALPGSVPGTPEVVDRIADPAPAAPFLSRSSQSPRVPALQPIDAAQNFTPADASAGAAALAAATAASGARRIPYVLLAWAVGAAVAATPLVLGALALRRIKRNSSPLHGPGWDELLARASRDLAIGRRVRLLRADHDAMPMTWGVLRPTVLLPAACDGWPGGRRRAVLLHELAHVKRWDCLWQLLVHLACAVHWFNPLAWVARAHAQREREQACDDLVLACGTADTDYAEQILHVAAGFRAPALAGAAAIPMARASQLEGRLVAILDRTRNRKAMTWGGIAFVALALLAVTIPVAILRTTDGRDGGEPASAAGGAEAAPADSPVFAEAVAGRFGRALTARKLPFLDEPRIAQLTADMRRFAAERLPSDLPADRRRALLDATDAYVARNFTPGNPTDPDSVDRIYLKFPDAVMTFQWHLWLAAERPALGAPEQARRDAQHAWLREHVRSLPSERPGVKIEEVMKRLDALLSDPLDPLFSTPMPDATFAKVHAAMRQYPPAGELAHAVAHAVQRGFDARYPDGERIPLPFEDRLAGWGAGTAIHLSFASNRRHAGSTIGVNDVEQSRDIADVRSPTALNFPAGLAGAGEVDRWLAREGRGDVGYDDANGGALFAVRGAKLLELDVHNWVDADRILDAELAAALRARGGRNVALAAAHERYKARGALGDLFAGVLTTEGALSVVRVQTFGPGVGLQIRARAAAEAIADARKDAPEDPGPKATVRSVATPEMLEARRFHFRFDRPKATALAFAFYSVTPDGKVQSLSHGNVQDNAERTQSIDYEGSLGMSEVGLVVKDRTFKTGEKDFSYSSMDWTHGNLAGTLSPLRVEAETELDGAYRLVLSAEVIRDGKPVSTLCYAVRTTTGTETLAELAKGWPMPPGPRKFEAAFPGGFNVEVVGVSAPTGPGGKLVWWAMDGTPLPDAKFTLPDDPKPNDVNGSPLRVQVLVRTTLPTSDGSVASVFWTTDAEPGRGWTMDKTYNTPGGGQPFDEHLLKIAPARAGKESFELILRVEANGRWAEFRGVAMAAGAKANARVVIGGPPADRPANHREAAAAFLRAVADDRIEDAYSLTTDAYRKGKPEGLPRLRQVLELKDFKLGEDATSADGRRAAIVTPPLPLRGRDRTGALGIGLVREGDRWLVRDLDALPDDDASAAFLAKFREATK